MKKIVFILGNYKNGGMAVRATNLANEFAARGYECDILATGEVGDSFFIELQNKVSVIAVENYNTEHEKDRKIVSDRKKNRFKIGFLKKLRYFTKRSSERRTLIGYRIVALREGELLRPYFINNPGVTVIVFGAPYIGRAVGATDGLNCKLIYSEKSAIIEPYDSRTAYYISRSDSVVVQTKDVAESIRGSIGGNVRTAVINNPLRPGLPEPFYGTRRKAIVTYCRLSPEKNIELLINAFSAFLRSHSDYILEIYGNKVSASEEKYGKDIEALIDRTGLSDAVRLLPPAADVHEKVKNAAMFVLSSDYEGLSNSMIEAMAIGLPCVCTDCLGGGTREVMVNGENGLIVPAGDAEAMRKAMERFADDAELSNKCSVNAAKISERLNPAIIAEKWIGIIE